MKPRNILLVTIDTLRADMLGCYGYRRPITPVMDELAHTGIRFEQAVTGGSWTQAAFPVLLTSTYASSYGGCLGPLSPARPSPVEALAACGYRTFGISSSPLLSKKFHYDRGFASFLDSGPDERDPWLRGIKGGERLLRQPLTHRILSLFKARLRPARLYLSAEQINREIDRRLQPDHEPFFGWVHYMDVHWPYHLEEDLVRPDEIARAWTDIAHLHRVNWKGETISPEQKAHYLDLYEGAIRYTDAQLGRLLDLLDKNGLREDTLIVITSDHGEEFLERGQWGHFEVNLHDEILRVPLIIHDPQSPEGRVVRRQVRTLDIMPTILDLAGCRAPDGLEGCSLAPLWREGESDYPSDPAIGEMWRNDRHIIALRTEQYKFIWDSREPDRAFLFDLVEDPGERYDVFDQFPDVAAAFMEQVLAHLDRSARTAPAEPLDEPEYDDEMTRRLRDLGYLE
jgi:arylsulfatase A-like enzyme